MIRCGIFGSSVRRVFALCRNARGHLPWLRRWSPLLRWSRNRGRVLRCKDNNLLAVLRLRNHLRRQLHSRGGEKGTIVSRQIKVRVDNFSLEDKVSEGAAAAEVAGDFPTGSNMCLGVNANSNLRTSTKIKAMHKNGRTNLQATLEDEAGDLFRTLGVSSVRQMDSWHR
mmetsp:Transcript_17254/g.47424  ORF Transcript_17254/g.47424 Transcript_17254/m.47424 type:complete len:169 (+) Transcript_17254:1029-1535(+)